MDFYAGQVVRGGRSDLEGVAEDEAIYRHEYVDGSLTSRKRIQVVTVATANGAHGPDGADQGRGVSPAPIARNYPRLK
jgi:hypothetical protein